MAANAHDIREVTRDKNIARGRVAECNRRHQFGIVQIIFVQLDTIH